MIDSYEVQKLLTNRNLVLAECKALFIQIIARHIFESGGITETQMQELVRKINVLIYGK